MSADVPPEEFDVSLPRSFATGSSAGTGDVDLEHPAESAALETGEGLELDPAIEFRRTLGMFATGVTVITTQSGDGVHGMTANAFMSVSLRPPLVLVSVDLRARMNALLGEGVRFGISVLADSQTELSILFAADRRRPRRRRLSRRAEHPARRGRPRASRRARRALLLGRRPHALPRARRVRALRRRRAIALPRGTLRAPDPRYAGAGRVAVRPAASRSSPPGRERSFADGAHDHANRRVTATSCCS